LTVWNRTQSKMKEIVDQGAKSGKSPRDVAAQSQVVITMLTGSADVEQVVLGKDGVLEGMTPGSTVIDMSTISPETSRSVASKVAAKGFSMLDAPVSGSIGIAANAALTIQVGGDAKVFDAHRDVLAAMGKNIFHVGGNGMGCTMKLVGNALMGVNMAVLAEALCLGAKAGIPTDVMVNVLKNTGGASGVLERRSPLVLQGDYKAQFMLKLLYKDLGLALDSAAVDPIPLPIIGHVRQIYAQAMAEGHGDQDFAAVAALAENLAKVSLKKK
ncbi:MAG TPA: NAD(P)-dependent oxidoreductase, partial [Thermodesulfobacteriota bacterium]|nr:NAD(P)-dependent oxidoreductase [Thermodesulfobacteriota bacterium]